MKEAQLIVRLFVWTLETIVLGNALGWRILKYGFRLPRLFADRMPCPRGHRSPVYGVYECGHKGCHAVFEGYVFDRCPICRESAGWTPCHRCGLPVRNPML